MKTKNEIGRNVGLVYIRVSTDKQADKGIALETQQDKCELYAKEQKCVFNPDTDFYVDRGASAKNMKRPALLSMLQRCKDDQTIKNVVVYDITRLARNSTDFMIMRRDLKKHGVRLVSASQPTEDNFTGDLIENILSNVAEYDSRMTGMKVRANMEYKAQNGEWPTRAPYGYANKQEKIGTEKQRAWIEVDNREAKWVTKLFELYCSGKYSIRSLADKLTKDGFPVRKIKNGSNKLNNSIVEKILKNDFYIGVIRWGDVVNKKGKHELFLDPALFHQAQAILSTRNAGASRQRRLQSFMKEVSYCDECGSKMTAEEQITSNGTEIRYLRCLKSKKGVKTHCKQKYGHESVYTEQLEKILKEIQLPPHIVKKLRARIKNMFANEQAIYERARRSITGKLDNVRERRKKLIIKMVDNDETQEDADIYQELKAELKAEEKQLQKELGAVENRIAKVVRTIEIALTLASNCTVAFTKTDKVYLKALLVRTLIKKMYMRDKKIVRVELNKPLDYICKSRIQGNPIFGLASSCGEILTFARTFYERAQRTK